MGAEGAVGGWFERAFRIGDFVTPTDQIRIRFDAVDLGEGSIIEAGVDGVRVVEYTCATVLAPCPPDLNGDRLVNGDDLGAAFVAFFTPDGDVDDDGITTVRDMILIHDSLGTACPE